MRRHNHLILSACLLTRPVVLPPIVLALCCLVLRRIYGSPCFVRSGSPYHTALLVCMCMHRSLRVSAVVSCRLPGASLGGTPLATRRSPHMRILSRAVLMPTTVRMMSSKLSDLNIVGTGVLARAVMTGGEGGAYASVLY